MSCFALVRDFSLGRLRRIEITSLGEKMPLAAVGAGIREVRGLARRAGMDEDDDAGAAGVSVAALGETTNDSTLARASLFCFFRERGEGSPTTSRPSSLRSFATAFFTEWMLLFDEAAADTIALSTSASLVASRRIFDTAAFFCAADNDLSDNVSIDSLMSSDATEQKWPYRANPNTLAALLREAGVSGSE